MEIRQIQMESLRASGPWDRDREEDRLRSSAWHCSAASSALLKILPGSSFQNRELLHVQGIKVLNVALNNVHRG